jgi:hypothetical protein
MRAFATLSLRAMANIRREAETDKAAAHFEQVAKSPAARRRSIRPYFIDMLIMRVRHTKRDH